MPVEVGARGERVNTGLGVPPSPEVCDGVGVPPMTPALVPVAAAEEVGAGALTEGVIVGAEALGESVPPNDMLRAPENEGQDVGLRLPAAVPVTPPKEAVGL